jgi:uncharacterized phage infection (PIP) family protein YhgE
MMGDSGITAGSIQQSVDIKMSVFETTQQRNEANYTSRMNEIDDSIQRINDDLAAIADKVTTRVLEGLQQPEGILFQQNAKIDRIQEQLLKLLPMVERVLGLTPTGSRALSDTESDSPTKIRKLDTASPMDMTGVQPK